MKKTIRLTESDLMKLVKRVINERMDSEEDLINATYDLMYDLGDEDIEILDLRDAANILDEELYEGNHGPIMEKRIENLLFKIEDIIGYYGDEGEDIEDHL